MAESILTSTIADDVHAFVVSRQSKGDRPDFRPAIEPERVEAIIRALIWLMNCRPSDYSSCYAFDNLSAAIGKTMAETLVAYCESQERGHLLRPEGGV